MTGPCLLAGADGCPAGWICLTRDLATGEIEAAVFESARELITNLPRPFVLAIDIPIGLPPKGSRNCDIEARRVLGKPRSCSVFPAPIRPALNVRTRDEASVIMFRADGRRVGVQSWGIQRKVREVDEVLRLDSNAHAFTREVHPEVSFWAWNGGRPMAHSKKRTKGREERLRLVDSYFGIGAFERVRSPFGRKEVASDDILDAFAALWTAERIYRGTSVALPALQQWDECGLPMEIVY